MNSISVLSNLQMEVTFLIIDLIKPLKLGSICL